MSSERAEHDGQADFDFFMGTWNVHHRLLQGRLKGSDSWMEFEGLSTCRKILNGHGNLEEATFYRESGTSYGSALRLYDPKSCEWRIYWAAEQSSVLDVPMIGHFENGRGEFYAHDIFEGTSIFSRFIWTVINENKCRWEQAFSEDGGKTWETNWIMDFTRQP